MPEEKEKKFKTVFGKDVANIDISEKKQEQEKKEEAPQIAVPSQNLEELVKNFDSFLRYKTGNSVFNANQLKDFYSINEINEFMQKLSDYEQIPEFQHAGCFLSFLINRCSADDITLKGGYAGVMNGLGTEFENKKLIYEGNPGDSVGYCMKSGKIEIIGNARNKIGESMSGGELLIRGSFGFSPGCNMRGGKIIIDGQSTLYTPSSYAIGYGMAGGEIHFNIPSFSKDMLAQNITKGKIYNKGKIVFFE